MTTNHGEIFPVSIEPITGQGGRTAADGRPRAWLRGGLIGCSLLVALAIAPVGSMGQGSLSKLPGHHKMKGSRQQAFSGVVQSLDRKMKILNVATHHGEDTEIFPVRRGTHVENLDGKRLALRSLVPGTDVLIYYSESGGKRSVQQVIVLEGAHKKKAVAKRRS